MLPMALAAALALSVATPDSTLRVMSFNVRFDNPRDGVHAWTHREDAVVDLLRAYAPDLIGLQEPLRSQIDALAARLPDYGWVGVGRSGGDAGEFSPIFYRTDRLRLVAHGTFWLSKTPEVVGSHYWDALYPRIATWAAFEDRRTGTVFFHVNTHLDVVGPFARRWGAHLIVDRLQAMAGGIPALVTGDLNAQPGSAPYRLLTENRRVRLRDARDEVEPVGPEGTYTGFSAGPGPARRLDYVFVSRGVEVVYYEVIAVPEGAAPPSDHRPVLADVVFPGRMP